MIGPVELVTQIVFGLALIAVALVIVTDVLPAIPRMIALLKGELR